ncbi:MAG: DUF3226 domain-containing protein [Bacteroidota bacterium]
MKQRLIVEGKDAIVLAEILKQRGLPPPKGYHIPTKFEKEFIKRADGIKNVETVLREQLETPSVERIGVVVDANSVGPIQRFNQLKSFIEATLKESLSTSAALGPKGYHAKVSDKLSIGIWIMPDNQNNGYLEHFISQLVPKDNPIWEFAAQQVEQFMQQTYCPFSEVKKQKALVHSYLALQKKPGLPMGTAVKSKYFLAESPAADHFEAWFKTTFELTA